MLNRKARFSMVFLAMSLAIMSFTTGCNGLKQKPAQTETETQSETETESESETQSETELETDVAYTSQDKSIRITMPDNTWKVTQDADEMRVFSSGAAAMISIVHADSESEMKNLSVVKSEDDLKDSLTKQYAEANAFEVQEFEKLSSDNVDTYEYVVKYNSTSMWTYAITYGIIAQDGDEAYVITGTVTDDNKVLLEAVKKSVESFTVLGNSVFSAMPGTVVNKTDTQSETQSESNVDTELKSLTEYGSSATLYASDIVNVRTKPSTDADVITTLNLGDQVTATGETSQWFRVNVSGNVGYVSKAFLVSTAPTVQSGSSQNGSSSAELNSYYDYGGSYTYYTTTDVNVRAQPGTDGDRIGGLGGGQAVTVIGETPNWYVVSINGTTGYISKSYISSENTSGSTGNNDTGDNGNGGDSNGGGSAGTVSGTIVDASLNTITIQGDDGNTYILNTSDASIDSADGIYTGLYVAASVDNMGTTSGALHATSVTGY